jgi:hypothetical protein
MRDELSITAQKATSCQIALDAVDPSTVVFASSFGSSTAPLSLDQTISEATFDGDVTWQRLAGNQLILALATIHGVTFALRQIPAVPGSGETLTTELAMSSDQLRTWTPIDAAIRVASPQEQPLDFSLNPTTGALLVSASDNNGGPPRLWSSSDTGQHWRELPTPGGNAVSLSWLVVQPPTGDAPWHVCGGTSGPTNMDSVACSTDGGATWTHPVPFPVAQQYRVGGLASDGALLLTGAFGVDAQGTPSGAMLYRLPAGATRWQTLGPVPEPVVRYASSPGAGTLWDLPDSRSAFDPQGRAFTAVNSRRARRWTL